MKSSRVLLLVLAVVPGARAGRLPAEEAPAAAPSVSARTPTPPPPPPPAPDTDVGQLVKVERSHHTLVHVSSLSRSGASGWSDESRRPARGRRSSFFTSRASRPSLCRRWSCPPCSPPTFGRPAPRSSWPWSTMFPGSPTPPARSTKKCLPVMKKDVRQIAYGDSPPTHRVCCGTRPSRSSSSSPIPPSSRPGGDRHAAELALERNARHRPQSGDPQRGQGTHEGRPLCASFAQDHTLPQAARTCSNSTMVLSAVPSPAVDTTAKPGVLTSTHVSAPAAGPAAPTHATSRKTRRTAPPQTSGEEQVELASHGAVYCRSRDLHCVPAILGVRDAPGPAAKAGQVALLRTTCADTDSSWSPALPTITV